MLDCDLGIADLEVNKGSLVSCQSLTSAQAIKLEPHETEWPWAQHQLAAKSQFCELTGL